MSKTSNPETLHPEGEVIPPQAFEPAAAALPRNKFGLAFTIAIVADLMQMVAFPMFAQGGFSPLDDLLDAAVGVFMVKLLGWHWAFLPTFLGKLIPFVDEVPCWTLAVLFVKTQQERLQAAERT